MMVIGFPGAAAAFDVGTPITSTPASARQCNRPEGRMTETGGRLARIGTELRRCVVNEMPSAASPYGFVRWWDEE